ncbi:MAG: hypothetical protein AAGG72_02150 [Pseudomonadota bacterium]
MDQTSIQNLTTRLLSLGAVAALTLAAGIAVSSVAPGTAQAAPCTRLPLSDVAFGKEAAIESARVKLRDYAKRVAAERGWNVARGFTESNEKVSCEVYLDLGPLGTEYQCLVTRTFCVR